jgi:hypothetical protein
MQKLIKLSALAASIAVLALAPAAMAQGGAGGGGGGGGGTARPVSTGGGGGGGGGGVNSGGVKDTGTTPAAPACATLTSVGAPVGYYSVWAALWNEYAVKSCGTASQSLTLTITNTNVATGAADFSYSAPLSLTPGQNTSGVVDNDFAPFSTDYNVQIDVRDGNGTVLDSRSLAATTPPQK